MDPCVGQWGDLPMDPDELNDLCDEIRNYAHCEELFIPDSEGVMQVNEVVEECGYLANIPENVARYFDYEAFGRDLDIEGTFIYAGGGVMIEIIR